MKLRLLLIDDSLLARMAVKKCISNLDKFDIYEAADGASGLAKYREIHPDITLLDLTMPVMDGFKTLEEIRKIDERAIVIILTADIQKKTTERVMSLGAFMALKKPPIKEEVIDALKKAEEILSKSRDLYG